MFREKPVAALVMGLMLLVACASSTTLTSTWQAPEAKAVSPLGQSIATVFVTSDEGLRRTGENALVSALSARGARAFGTFHLTR
jgi:hypothetical protein